MRHREFQQTLFQHFQRGDIEIVGRFVEQKQVRRAQHQLRDPDSSLFAAGKLRDERVEFRRGWNRNGFAQAATCIGRSR